MSLPEGAQVHILSSELFRENAMIVVRDIFQLKFGKAKDAVALVKQSEQLRKKYGYGETTRYLTDLTGSYYTLVMETTYDGLGSYETSMQRTMGSEEFGAWYKEFMPLIVSGSREIFKIVE